MQDRALKYVPAGGTNVATTVSAAAVSCEVALKGEAKLSSIFKGCRVGSLMDLVEVLFKMFCICNPHATDHTVASEPVPKEAIIKQLVPAMQRVLKALLAYKRHLHFRCFLLWALRGRRGDGCCWALSWLR